MKLQDGVVAVCALALALPGCALVTKEARPVVHFDSTAVGEPTASDGARREPIPTDVDIAPSACVPALPAFWDCASRREWTWRAQPHFARRS